MQASMVQEMRSGERRHDIPVAADIVAGLGYLRPMEARPYNYMYEPPDGGPWQNCEYDVRAMRIGDARRAYTPPSVQREGFELWSAPTLVKDFLDEDAIARLYYPEAAELACAVTGGTRAYVFDHLVRKREAGRPALGFGRHGDGSKPAAVGRIHNDYTEHSGRRRLAMAVKETNTVKRFAIVNIWRSIKGPVLDTPLAVCDARTVSALDLVCADLRYPP